jgi:hypothetical protein
MKTIALSGILAFSMAAQTPTEPAPLVQLIRKPKIGAAPVRPYAEARATVDVVGMTSVTGTPEIWLMEAHQSFASVEDLEKAIGAVAPATPTNEYTGRTGATGRIRRSECSPRRGISTFRSIGSGRVAKLISAS